MLLVADSGIGGLSVTRALRRLAPGLPMTYLADPEGFPYGAWPDAALSARLVELLGQAIAQLRPDAVLLACNTASTVALPALRRHFTVPFIGCVPPIKPAAACSRTRCIGLLATEATVRRAYVQDLTRRFAADCTVLSHGSATLAALAEAAFRGESPDQALLRQELDRLLGQPGGDRIDSVVLGCTHYAFLLSDLRAIAPQIAFWLDPAEPVARHALSLLQHRPGPAADGLPPQVALVTAPLPDATRQGLAAFGFPLIQPLAIAACS